MYRGVQLATGRKVALKLLHPEMTKDENLVARFRREGMVLCNLRDAHTITTYDFDQTPDGTLYIAMELLEGKSLHQIFHEQAPLEWKRVFKILSEMCSSLAEAHAQGIVHRDLKPENIYLESRPGNPEFVKILDFGIAKVMRGDTIDPQSPQLTATGQTLGTLEYMSPEQLMGKPLDGRSDVYALGVRRVRDDHGPPAVPRREGPGGPHHRAAQADAAAAVAGEPEGDAPAGRGSRDPEVPREGQEQPLRRRHAARRPRCRRSIDAGERASSRAMPVRRSRAGRGSPAGDARDAARRAAEHGAAGDAARPGDAAAADPLPQAPRPQTPLPIPHSGRASAAAAQAPQRMQPLGARRRHAPRRRRRRRRRCRADRARGGRRRSPYAQAVAAARTRRRAVPAAVPMLRPPRVEAVALVGRRPARARRGGAARCSRSSMQ